MNSKINNLKYITAISVVIILAIATLAIACIGCTNSDLPDSSFNITDGDGNVLSGDKVYEMPRQINFTAAALAANPAGVSIQIQATVYPDNAANKAVDWSVAWANGSDSDIASYIRVTPTADGSTTAMVTCFAAFSNDIHVIVTTRDGGYQATCVIKFVGIATGISVSSSVPKSGEFFQLTTNSTNVFNINLTNSFDKTSCDLEITSVSAYGDLYFYDYKALSGKVLSYSNIGLQSISKYVDRFITSTSVNGSNIVVTTGSTQLGGLYRWTGGPNDYNGNEATYRNVCAYWDQYYDNNPTDLAVANIKQPGLYNVAHFDDCYLTVNVRDKISKLSTVIKIKMIATVQSVSLSTTTLTF